MSEVMKVEAGAVEVLDSREMLSVEQMKEQVQVIQQLYAAVMKKGVHYDSIPGTGKWEKNKKTGKTEYVEGKPVLLKPGAEKVNFACRIGSEPITTREFDGFDTHFNVMARMFSINTGTTLGFGVGAGSTKESKWAWRRAICHEEYEATPETKRRIHWQKKYKDNYKEKDEFEAVEQVRQNPADIINTVLKMAVKRAEVDGCRKVTACSDVFDMDIDEDHIRDAVIDPADKAPVYQQPAQRQPEAPPPGDVISEPQRKRLYAISKGRGLTDEESAFVVFNVAGVSSSKDIPRDKYEAVCTAIEAAEPGKVIDA